MDDTGFYEGSEVGDTAGGEKERCESFIGGFGWSGFIGDGGWRDGKGEGGCGDEVFCLDVKAVDLFVTNAKTVEDDFRAETANLDKVLKGRLRMGITKSVVRGPSGVPFRGQRVDLLGFRGGVWQRDLVMKGEHEGTQR